MTLDELEKLTRPHLHDFTNLGKSEAEVKELVRKLIAVVRAADGIRTRCRELANDYEFAEGDGFYAWEEKLNNAFASLDDP